ncbi:MAG: hypothetical protein GY754_19870 [bacterium]|nr:hypothetical protein [bacterium]
MDYHIQPLLAAWEIILPIMDENNYGDCYIIEGVRELVAEWEEKAKEIFFSSKAKCHYFCLN